jgi:hypothetical protein
MLEVTIIEFDTLAVTLMDLDAVGEGDGVREVDNEAKRTILDLINDLGEGARGGGNGASKLGGEGAGSGAIQGEI